MWVPLQYNPLYEVHTTRKIVKSVDRAAVMKMDKSGCIKLAKHKKKASFHIDDLVAEGKTGVAAEPRSTWG